VRAALQRGLAIHFCPARQHCGSDDAIVMSEGQIVLTASQKDGVFYLNGFPLASSDARVSSATVSVEQLTWAWECHRRLGHIGFGTLAELSRQGGFADKSLTPDSFVQARERRICEPCVIGKLCRTSHPARMPRPVRVLHRVHMDVCELDGIYFGTVVDEATRFSCVSLLHREGDTAIEVQRILTWCETQTDKRAQRVRHDRGGEYMVGTLQRFSAERGIQYNK
jgi:hypothetical protein